MPKAIGVVVVAVFALIILAGMGVGMFQSSLASAATEQTVTNESFTPSAGSITTLSNSSLDGAEYLNNETIYNASGVTMTEGTDYKWFTSNGTLKTLAGGDLAGDASGEATYSYERADEEARGMADLAAQVPSLLGLAAPALVFVLMLAFVKGMMS